MPITCSSQPGIGSALEKYRVTALIAVLANIDARNMKPTARTMPTSMSFPKRKPRIPPPPCPFTPQTSFSDPRTDPTMRVAAHTKARIARTVATVSPALS